MTALNCKIHHSRAIEILTDTLAIDPTKGGVPAGFVAKVMPMPHLRCALATAGQITLLGAFAAKFGEAFRTFDAMLDGAADLVRANFMQARDTWEARDESTVLIAGFSERTGAAAARSISLYPFAAEPFVIEDIEHGSMRPAVNVDDLDFAAPGFLLDVIERQRAAFPQGVGGHAQRTVITPEGITTSIVRTWENANG